MKKKLLFGITSLTLGGAERVLVDLANALCDEYEITIFTIYAKGELEKQLSNKVKLQSLYNKQYSELNNIQRKIIPLKILLNNKIVYSKYIKGNYDVEVAFLEGPVTRLFSVKNKNTRKIAWIHNDISQVFGTDIIAKIKKKVDKNIYSKYETLVFVSQDNLKKFNKEYKNIEKQNQKSIKEEVIYNYIDKENIKIKAEEKTQIPFDKKSINFVTVARLVPQKAIDRIITIHKKIIDEGFKHNFYVIGEGPEKEKLEKLIKEFNVQESFHLLGKKENPYPYIKNSDYFCLLSKFEGYGMVLEEAKILEKPIIITDTAAREAVNNYKATKIVENTEDGIYKGVKELIEEFNKENLEKEYIEYDNSNIINKIKCLIGE